MDTLGLTEADRPLRSKRAALIDVIFQYFWEGPASPITDMYVEAALKLGASTRDVSVVLTFCRYFGTPRNTSIEGLTDLAYDIYEVAHRRMTLH